MALKGSKTEALRKTGVMKLESVGHSAAYVLFQRNNSMKNSADFALTSVRLDQRVLHLGAQSPHRSSSSYMQQRLLDPQKLGMLFW